MNRFNVLDRSLNIHQHYLLEASAGTGKTFSIQNIVVRLLIEVQEGREPFSLQQILVVTFTRAAARDLRLRIRSTIEQSLYDLQRWLNTRDFPDQAPDYIKACIEEGIETAKLARKRLQHALFTFDQAQIFTIHAFCSRMLKQYAMESDFGFHVVGGEEPLPRSEVMGVVRDFFRTEVRLEHYSPAQIEILLKGDPHQNKLIKQINSGHSFAQFPSVNSVLMQFNEIMQTLKEQFSLTSKHMIDDFKSQAEAYKNDKSNGTKSEALERVSRFAQLFDRSEWSLEDLDLLIHDGIVWVKALNPTLLKARAKIPSLHYPELTHELRTTLHPLIEQARSFPALLARMAGDCQRHFQRYQNEEEKLSPDDVLRKMDTALNQDDFANQIQETYQAAIIDEFQDTDPLQWKIFQRLFLSENFAWKGRLYLVGDPKQSIYSFRQADIYTYLAAAKTLGHNHCYSLDVNYRSQPCLIDALNHLFAADHLPYFIPLPKQSIHLPYQPVQAPEMNQNEPFDDLHGAIHFCIGDGSLFPKAKLNDLESHIFFPFIANEILRLRSKKKFAYKQFAVLVRDKHQAARLTEFLGLHHIPTINQKGSSLADSPALQSFIELMQAIMHPHHRSMLCTALGNQLLGWTQDEIKAADAMEFALFFIQRLRSYLFENGFASFFQELLQTSCKPCGSTILENLLSREGGLEFYRDLRQIGDIVIDNQTHEWNGFEGIIPFLDQLKLWDENDDERLKRYQDPGADGVKILTLHISKGLEFDVVFALGLINRLEIKEDLFPVENGKKLVMTPLEKESVAYKRHCEEVDAEKMRQLYVALTRAKYQLYIPVALNIPSNKLSYGDASPMDLFLARLLQPAVEYDTLYDRIRNGQGDHLIDFIDRTGREHSITYSMHREKISVIPRETSDAPSLELHEPSVVPARGVPLLMTSFTTLSRQIDHGDLSENLKMISAPKDYQSESRTVHTLPANSETGLLIHSIMENLNYGDFKNMKTVEEAIPLVNPYTHNSSYRGWEYAVAALAFNTLKVPLRNISENFCLAQVDPAAQFREMPFLFPMQHGENIEEIASQEGLIKGVIDYLFVHDGMYYVVDWKSNWLGPQNEDYNTQSMQAAMQENSYFLQAAIYTEALRRYLKLVETRPFKQCFGGVFYFFLRGVQSHENTGIYHFFPQNFK